MGHGGMLYNLPSRELIADSVEYMVQANCADAARVHQQLAKRSLRACCWQRYASTSNRVRLRWANGGRQARPPEMLTLQEP